ncbi:MAG: hypothetical protein R3C28_22555 [Pirellulaceae bacterium]
MAATAVRSSRGAFHSSFLIPHFAFCILHLQPEAGVSPAFRFGSCASNNGFLVGVRTIGVTSRVVRAQKIFGRSGRQLIRKRAQRAEKKQSTSLVPLCSRFFRCFWGERSRTRLWMAPTAPKSKKQRKDKMQDARCKMQDADADKMQDEK